MNKELLEALHTEPEVQIPEDFSSRVLSSIKKEEKKEKLTNLIWWFSGVSALLITLVASLWYWLGLGALQALAPAFGWAILISILGTLFTVFDPMIKAKPGYSKVL